MEKAILRRDMISMKGRVSKAKKTPDMTEAGLKKAVAELKRRYCSADYLRRYYNVTLIVIKKAPDLSLRRPGSRRRWRRTLHFAETLPDTTVFDWQREGDRLVRETDAETAASEGRIQELTAQREEMGRQLEELSKQCSDLQSTEEQLRGELNSVAMDKTRTLVMTAQAQRMGKRVEDYRTGKYRMQHDGECQ
eukprot:7608813-Pyramimonas_sp.AAC.1